MTYNLTFSTTDKFKQGKNVAFPPFHKKENKAIPSAAAQGTHSGLTGFAQWRACLPWNSEITLITLSSSRARL